MQKTKSLLALALFCFMAGSPCAAQERKLEKIRVGGGSVGAPQMTMWFAKEANFYEKHGLAVEAISIPGSSMALQAMLSGEVPIIQLGGTASMLANFAGADTVIVAPPLSRSSSSRSLADRRLLGLRILKANSSARRASARSPTLHRGLRWKETVSILIGTSRWYKPVDNPRPWSPSLPEKFRAPHCPFLLFYGPRKQTCANCSIWLNWRRPFIRTAS